ncbi:putative lipase [Cocos nucifera]|uniref:Putative lipase n=1 Tax=Cocos nucifera TaxID=13894 RepID=A0A8K0I4D6_COCNU|nr:putative lipase [Cocos nucifera]
MDDEAQQLPARGGEGLDSSRSVLNFGFHIMSTSKGSVTASKGVSQLKNGPDHLLVLVHGILARSSMLVFRVDVLFIASTTHFYQTLATNTRYGNVGCFLKVQIMDKLASSSNAYTKTLSGVDGAGRRLADEVLNVVQKTESLKKISFLAHSLGGLFTRYAITILYNQDILNRSRHENVISSSTITSEESACSSNLGKIAGLEPINFITLATPHLGLPFLLGVPILEKLAAPLAPIFIGRTGRQLFLTDGKPSKPPLLLRMTSDYEDNKFISALASFKSRTLYANVSYDRILL